MAAGGGGGGGPGRTRRPVRGDRAASLHCIRRRRENNRRRRRRPPALGAAAAARPVSRTRRPPRYSRDLHALPLTSPGVRACPETGKKTIIIIIIKSSKIMENTDALPLPVPPRCSRCRTSAACLPAPSLALALPRDGVRFHCPSALLALGKVCLGRGERGSGQQRGRAGVSPRLLGVRASPLHPGKREPVPRPAANFSRAPPPTHTLSTAPRPACIRPRAFLVPAPGSRRKAAKVGALGGAGETVAASPPRRGGCPRPPAAGRRPAGARFGLLLRARGETQGCPPHGTGERVEAQ